MISYFKDAKALNIKPATVHPKATEHIDDILALIQRLVDNGHAYVCDNGDVYFDTKSDPEYGKLSGQNLDDLELGARIEVNDIKKNPMDFALWKAKKDINEISWKSPWGEGRPGWHIECSAMSRDILGDKIDIHTGGIDHKTVHHEDEIAQNDALSGHRVVNTWMHNEFLLVDGGKMSKSLGNVYTISNLKERGFEPLDFKYFCQNTHYSKKINFTFEGLKASAMGYKKLKANIAEHKHGTNAIQTEVLKSYKQKFLEAINDDLNYPLALGVVWTMLKTEPKSKQVYDLVLQFDKALGLSLEAVEEEKQPDTVPQNIKDLAEQRKLAREQKNWVESDRLRDKIAELGYKIKDSKEGYELEKI